MDHASVSPHRSNTWSPAACCCWRVLVERGSENSSGRRRAAEPKGGRPLFLTRDQGWRGADRALRESPSEAHLPPRGIVSKKTWLAHLLQQGVHCSARRSRRPSPPPMMISSGSNAGLIAEATPVPSASIARSISSGRDLCPPVVDPRGPQMLRGQPRFFRAFSINLEEGRSCSPSSWRTSSPRLSIAFAPA